MKIKSLLIILFAASLNVFSQKYIADYEIAKESVLRQIPTEYIYKARNELHIAYWHTSHGTHVFYGLSGLQDYKAGDDTLFAITESDPTPGKLDFRDNYGTDLSVDETGFIQTTRYYLDDPNNAATNVIMWSWCDIAYHDVATNYIPRMDSLISEYGIGGSKIGTGPGQRINPVTFIYMTGHGNTGSNLDPGEPKPQADLIVANCNAKQQYCLDYFSIDAHDMDDNYWEDAGEDGQSGLYGGNFYHDFQNSHTLGVDYFENKNSPGGSVTYGEHNTQHITANRKAYAMWWILARIAGWDGNISGITDEEAPSAPSNLSASAVSNARIDLSWETSSDNVGVTGYTVYRNGAVVDVTTQLTYSDNNLDVSTEYSYYVIAADAAGNTSGQSNTASATTLDSEDTEDPTPPVNLTATAISATQINLSWEEANDNVGVTEYIVYRNTDEVARTDASATSYSDEGLTQNTEYTYYVIAVDAAGNSSNQSNMVNETTQTSTDTEPPTTPSMLEATVISCTRIDLTWAASTDNISDVEYVVYRDDSQIGTTTDQSYSDTWLSPTTEYSYYVVARDEAGNTSDESDHVNATTNADSEAPAAPGNLTANNITESQIGFYWDEATDNIGVTAYYIYRNNTIIDTVDAGITNYLNRGLRAETEYSYYVTAADAAGNESDPSNTVTETTGEETDTEAPTAPSNLSLVVISASQIGIDWDESTDNNEVSEYVVYRNGSEIAKVDAPTSNYLDEGLTPETEYSYYVVAIDGAGNTSDPSDTATETTDEEADNEAPSTPSNLSLTVISSTQIGVDWDESTDNNEVSEYIVYRNGSEIARVSASISSYLDEALTQATEYSYYIVAVDGAGNTSDPSDTATETTDEEDNEAPSSPANVSLTVSSPTQIDINWDESTDNIAVIEYVIYRNNVEIATITSPVTSYSDEGLKPETEYNYSVVAEDAAGNTSDPSNTATGTTEADTEAPTAPDNVTLTVSSSTQISISWDESTDNVEVVEYRLFRDESEIATVSSSFKNYSDEGLYPETSYTYYVVAIDGSGNISEHSNSANGTTLEGIDIEAPTTPTNLRVRATSNSQMDLTWSASMDNRVVAGYRIFRDGVLIDSVSEAKYCDSNLNSSTLYVYHIVAFDSQGNLSPVTSKVSARTLGASVYQNSDIQPIKVYPNPSHGIVNFILPDNSEDVNFKLYSITGASVAISLENWGNNSNFRIDLNNQAPGIYIYHIIVKGKSITGKFKLIR